MCTGTSYQSDIKTEGASIAHRKHAFETERRRMASASSFTVVGSGVVGSELALDLRSFFPDKPVNVVTRSEVGWLPRVPGAHKLVAQVCDEKGVSLVTGKVIKKTDEDGRLVTADGEHLGEKGARTCNWPLART
jgi:NADH dehydrogenase FAD-containing subunit